MSYGEETAVQDGKTFDTAFDLGSGDTAAKTVTVQPNEKVYFKHTLREKSKYGFTVTGGQAYLSRYDVPDDSYNLSWNGKEGDTYIAKPDYDGTWYYSILNEGDSEAELTLTVQRFSLYVDSSSYSTSGINGVLGKPVSMTTEATSTLGADKLQYQWQRSGESGEWQDIAGATGETYLIDAVTEDMAGSYRCVVTDGQCTDTKEFQFSVTAGLETAGYGNFIHVWTGDTVTLDSKAFSMVSFTCKWSQRSSYNENWTEIAGATESTYTFTMGEDTPKYYYCEVNDGYQRKTASFELVVHGADEKKPVSLELSPNERTWYIYELCGGETEWLKGWDYSKKLKVIYSDGSEEYIGSNITKSNAIEKDENGDWKEGWHKIIYSYLGTTVELPVYVVRMGRNGIVLLKVETVSGETAGNAVSEYGYYGFCPDESGAYEFRFSGVSGAADVELYQEKGQSSPLKTMSVSGDGKVTCELEAGVNYFVVVRSSSGTAFTYSITADELQNEMVLGQEYELVKDEKILFTFTPEVSGFYHLNEKMGCSANIYDEDMNLIDKFDTADDEDGSYLRAGTKYSFSIETYFDGSVCSLNLTEQASFGSDIVLANRDHKITFTLDNAGVLAYSGTGSLTDNYSYHIADKAVIKKIVIGEGITDVGSPYSRKFANCTGLTEVSLPSTVTSIPSGAFENCVNLTTVSLPENNSLEEIGEKAFYNTAFYSNQSGDFIMIGNIVLDYVGTDEAVVVPENSVLLAYGAMRDKDTLKQVTILDKLKKIDEFGMAECDSLPEINVPGNVTDIEYCAFYSDTALENAVLNEGVESIGEEAFFGCEELKTITIPKSVTNIGSHAIGYSHAVIDTYNSTATFYKNEEGPLIKCYYKTSGYWYAKNGGFSYELLDEKDLSNKDIAVVSVYRSSVDPIPKVTVVFAETTLAENTDYSVQISGDTVTVEGKGAYFGSQTVALPEITAPTPAPATPTPTTPPATPAPATPTPTTAPATPAPTIAPTAAPATPTPTPAAVKKGTTFTSGKYKYQVTGAATVTFTGLKSKKVTKVSVPASVKYKGVTYSVTAVAKKALYKNANVTQITVGNKVTSIGDYAFAGCKKLKKVTLGTGVKSIGKYAMKSSTKLSSVTIKSTKLKTVKTGAFKSIYSKATIKVPSKKLSAYKKLLKNKGLSSKAKIKK